MRISASILAVVAAAFLASSARAEEPTAPANQEAAAESLKKVKELQQERIAVLKNMSEILTRLYAAQKGASYEEVLEASQLLVEAQLEAAETDKERVELFKTLIDELKKGEALAQARKVAAQGTEVPILKWKAMRLEAEIRLEKVKLKLASAGK